MNAAVGNFGLRTVPDLTDRRLFPIDIVRSVPFALRQELTRKWPGSGRMQSPPSCDVAQAVRVVGR